MPQRAPSCSRLPPIANEYRWPRRYFFERTTSQADSEARVPRSGVVSIRGQPEAGTLDIISPSPTQPRTSRPARSHRTRDGGNPFKRTNLEVGVSFVLVTGMRAGSPGCPWRAGDLA